MNSVMNKIWGIVEKKIYVIIKKIYEFSGRSLAVGSVWKEFDN